MAYNMRKHVLTPSRGPKVVGSIELTRETILRVSDFRAEFDKEPKMLYIQLFMPGAIAPMITITRNCFDAAFEGMAAAPSTVAPDGAAENDASPELPFR